MEGATAHVPSRRMCPADHFSPTVTRPSDIVRVWVSRVPSRPLEMAAERSRWRQRDGDGSREIKMAAERWRWPQVVVSHEQEAARVHVDDTNSLAPLQQLSPELPPALGGNSAPKVRLSHCLLSDRNGCGSGTCL